MGRRSVPSRTCGRRRRRVSDASSSSSATVTEPTVAPSAGRRQLQWVTAPWAAVCFAGVGTSALFLARLLSLPSASSYDAWAYTAWGQAFARGVAPERSIRHWEADFFHQFILGGAYRCLRLRQRAKAREVLGLFDLPELRHLGASPKWLPVRVVLTAATAGVRKQDESALQEDR